MPNITFVLADGTEKQVYAPNGISLLEVAHKNEIPLEGGLGAIQEHRSLSDVCEAQERLSSVHVRPSIW